MFSIEDMIQNKFIFRSELKFHAKSIISIRDWNADYIKGQYRNEMAENFDRVRYGQRNKVETVFSVIKRRFGEEIKGRFYRSQVKELKLKCIVYSVDLFLSIAINPSLTFYLRKLIKIYGDFRGLFSASGVYQDRRVGEQIRGNTGYNRVGKISTNN